MQFCRRYRPGRSCVCGRCRPNATVLRALFWRLRSRSTSTALDRGAFLEFPYSRGCAHELRRRMRWIEKHRVERHAVIRDNHPRDNHVWNGHAERIVVTAPIQRTKNNTFVCDNSHLGPLFWHPKRSTHPCPPSGREHGSLGELRTGSQGVSAHGSTRRCRPTAHAPRAHSRRPRP